MRLDPPTIPTVCLFMLVMAMGGFLVAQQPDVRGSADHPLFPNRMPGYYISNSRVTEFEAVTFQTADGPQTIEGKVTRINYRRDRDTPHPGGLAIRRNYENAITEAGGDVVSQVRTTSVLRASTGGVEVWVELQASDNPNARLYQLLVLERAAMAQVITAESIAAALDRAGSVSLSIEFDTGKADIRPASLPIIAEIVSVLQADGTLRLTVEGHTDDVGSAESNQVLSEARAQAVVAGITARGIASERLAAQGFGETRPVADNTTDEGRAANRRVMLVKANP
jgi:outer membrane protein OmpA-like peptidoglycan-associated protein